MRSDEAVTATLRAAFITDTDPEYTAAVILNEINNTFANVFGPLIVASLGNAWLKHQDAVTIAARNRYRIPARALVGGVKQVLMANPAGNYYPLEEATPAQAPDIAGDTTNSTQLPAFYRIEGDQLELLPTPSTAGTPLRTSYYLSPSRLVTQQSSTLGGGTVRGQITSIAGIASRQVVVNVIPYDQELAVPAALTTAVQRIDIVKPPTNSSWQELALVSAPQTFAALTFTIGGTDSLADVEVGDFVRVSEQTDWPCLPREFQQTLCDATAVRIMLQKNWLDKANALAKKIGLSLDGDPRPPGPRTDLGRFFKLIAPRNQTQPPKVVRRTGLLYGGANFGVWPRGAVR